MHLLCIIKRFLEPIQCQFTYFQCSYLHQFYGPKFGLPIPISYTLTRENLPLYLLSQDEKLGCGGVVQSAECSVDAGDVLTADHINTHHTNIVTSLLSQLELQTIHQFLQSRRRLNAFSFKTLLRHYAKQARKHGKQT